MKRSSLPTIVAVALISLTAVVLPEAAEQHLHPAKQAAAPVIGAAAIPFQLKSLDGATLTLENYRGRPLVINFFASWCDPCREEMPVIRDLADKSDREEYRVVGIAVEDTRAAVIDFAKESKLAFPIALDLNSAIKRAYRIFGPPATFFIDSQGIIRDIVLGPITPERAQQAMKKIVVSSAKS